MDASDIFFKTFDGDFFAKPSHNDLAVSSIRGGFDGEQVAIKDANVPHGQAADFEQVVWCL